MTAGVPYTVRGDIRSWAQWPCSISGRAVNDRAMGAWLMSSAVWCLWLQEDLWISAFHIPVDRLAALWIKVFWVLVCSHTGMAHSSKGKFRLSSATLPSSAVLRVTHSLKTIAVFLKFWCKGDMCTGYTLDFLTLYFLWYTTDVHFGFWEFIFFFYVLWILQNFIHPAAAFNDPQWYWRYEVPLRSANGRPEHSVLQRWISIRIHWVSSLETAFAKSEWKS